MKAKFFFLSAALALTALWGCQRETPATVNPTYDPEANTVNTQFILNISTTSGAPATKMTAKDVQASGADFRGMDEVHLLTYHLDYTGTGSAHYMFNTSDATSKATRDFNLGTLENHLGKDDDDKYSATRVLELALPLQTNAIMLYGRAAKTGTDNAQGSVTASGTVLNSSLDNVKFTLDSRLTDATAYTQYGDLMSYMLTGIMNARLDVETPANGHRTNRDNTYKFWWPVTDANKTLEGDFAVGSEDADGKVINVGGTDYTLHRGSITWKQYSDRYADDTQRASMKALEEVVGEAYFQVMYLKTKQEIIDDSDPDNIKYLTKTELRAGSSAAVLRLVNDMFAIINRVRNAEILTPEEYVVRLLADEIMKRAGYFFQSDAEGNVTYRSLDSFKSGVNTMFPSTRTWDGNYNRITEDFFYSAAAGRAGFPLNLGLPLGAAIMEFVPTTVTHLDYNVVTYPNTVPAYGMGTSERFPVANYRYPAELMYYANSPIRTSDNVMKTGDFPITASAWTSTTTNYWGTFWSTEVNGVVSSTTRSVAVARPVNYGTAMLKSIFYYGSNAVKDNNAALHAGESDNTVDVASDGNKFIVTGIMIGGVDDQVGWNFLPCGTDFNKMVYDNLESGDVAIPKYATGSERYSNPVYTLTWDNYNKSLAIDKQSKVYIGVEVLNNTGEDLWGELNLIRAGGTFYLVGELDPQSASALAKLPKDGDNNVNLTRSDCYYPPYDADGKTLNAVRVFMQDYVTNVKFNFSENSLKHAYVTMPDLRAGQVSLGLSVDLEWEEGLDFDIELGKTD